MGGTATDRLEFFSDGVIAIAITLLVLQIDVPDAHHGQLFHLLVRQWPSYAAYVLSFAVIGIMWVSHHSMFERIGTIDRGLLFANLALLSGIAFLPFPTALLAQYAHKGGANAHIAAATYSITMTMIGLAFLVIWWHLIRHPELLGEDVDPANLRRSIRRAMVSPIVFGATIGLAFVNAMACFVVYGLAVAYFAAGPATAALYQRRPRRDDRATPDDPSPRGPDPANAPTSVTRPAGPAAGAEAERR